MSRVVRANVDTIDFFLGSSEMLVTNPRDRVYAFLGLSKDLDKLIKPDYALTIQETYYDLSRCLISQGFGKSLVANAGLSRLRLEGLPSWCLDLDFSKANDLGKASLFEYGKVHRLHLRASSDSTGTYNIGPKPSELTVVGLRVDRIQQLGPTRISSPPRAKARLLAGMGWLRDTRRFLFGLDGAAGSRYPSREERLNCFCRIIVADDDRFSETAVQSHLAFLRNVKDLFNNMLRKDGVTTVQKTQEFELKQRVIEYQELLTSITKEHRLCVTEQGYFGLVHEQVEVGDEICIVLGCDVPLVMREAPMATRDTFLLVMLSSWI